MNVFTCIENSDDRVAVSACGEGVLVVISSADKGKAVELELTTGQARQAADAVRAMVANPGDVDPATYGPLLVSEGGEEDTVYLSELPASTDILAVLLTNEDAEEFATSLHAAANDSDTLRLGQSLNTATQPLTHEQVQRVAALMAASHALGGGRRSAGVVVAAHYILTGEVVA